MIETYPDPIKKIPLNETSAKLTEEQEITLHIQPSRLARFWGGVKRYPIPVIALVLLFVSLLFWLIGRVDFANWALFCIVVVGGVPLLWETVNHFVRKELSVDFIAILAIAGSLILNEYLAGAFVVLMLSGGEALEAYALRRARSSLSALAERAPRTAHIWQGDKLVNVPAESIEVGMEVVVKPGEMIPVDGVIERGTSSVSEADLTGEPVPIRKMPGMPVLSGSVNLDGVLEVQASKRSAESKYAQIVRLVQEAQEQKAPIHRLADRYSIGFTLLTIVLAAASWIFSGDSVFALAVLVVATPCPLILATPIAIMSGIDLAARNGIIVKSGAVIEQLGEVNVAIFDKTGTLTLGTPKVTTIIMGEKDGSIEKSSYSEDELLSLAASVEQLSSHILAHSVVEAAHERGLKLIPATDFVEMFGQGVVGSITTEQSEKRLGNHSVTRVGVGNHSFMVQLGVTIPEQLQEQRKHRIAEGQIVSFLAIDGEVEGLIVMADIPRSDLSQLSAGLKKTGIEEIVLLTGDSDVVAQQIGKVAKVDHVISRCLPEDKVNVVREIVRQGHKVLMVGDGVNDAPALASATVGLAIGSQGLTAAAVAADAVLLSTDILRVVTATRLGRSVMKVALQGIWIGMGLSAVAMVFAAFGFIPPAIGAILQEGIDVIVILNALRAGHLKN